MARGTKSGRSGRRSAADQAAYRARKKALALEKNESVPTFAGTPRSNSSSSSPQVSPKKLSLRCLAVRYLNVLLSIFLVKVGAWSSSKAEAVLGAVPGCWALYQTLQACKKRRDEASPYLDWTSLWLVHHTLSFTLRDTVLMFLTTVLLFQWQRQG